MQYFMQFFVLSYKMLYIQIIHIPLINKRKKEAILKNFLPCDILKTCFICNSRTKLSPGCQMCLTVLVYDPKLKFNRFVAL